MSNTGSLSTYSVVKRHANKPLQYKIIAVMEVCNNSVGHVRQVLELARGSQ